MYPPTSNSAVRDFARSLFRHKGKGCTFFVVVMALAVAVTILMPRRYRSEGTLFVHFGRENTAVDPLTAGGAVITNVGDMREYEVNSIAATLTSRQLLGDVVDAVGAAAILDKSAGVPGNQTQAWWSTLGGLLKSEVSREDAIRAVEAHVSVDAVRKSSVVGIAYTAHSAELAQAVVAKLMDLYLEQYARLNRTRGTHKFLAAQTQEMRAELNRREVQLRDLKGQTGIIAPERQRQLFAEQISQRESDLLAALLEKAACEARVHELETRLAGLPETKVLMETEGPDKALEAMREQLYLLELKEQQLVSSTKPGYFEIEEIRKQLPEARAILNRQPARKEVTRGPNHCFEELQLALLQQQPTLAALRTRADTLETQLAAARKQLRDFNDNDLRVAQLQRELDLCSADYRKYAASLEQSRLDEAVDLQRMSSINIAQPATCDAKPVRPRPLLYLGIAFVLACFGAVAWPWLAENLDRSFETREQVEQQLGLRVVAVIPRRRKLRKIVHT